MKFRHLVFGLIATIASLVSPLATRTVWAQTLAGVYSVEGINPASNDGYRGVVETNVVDVEKGIYSFVWTTGKTPEGEWIESIGFGFVENGQLSVIITDGTTFIVAKYTLKNGTWEGSWLVAGTNAMSTEKLIPTDKSAEFLKKTLPSPGAREL